MCRTLRVPVGMHKALRMPGNAQGFACPGSAQDLCVLGMHRTCELLGMHMAGMHRAWFTLVLGITRNAHDGNAPHMVGTSVKNC